MKTKDHIISLNLPFEQLAIALRQLPPEEKITLWRLLDEEIDRAAIIKRFSEALVAIRTSHPNITEEEVTADVLEAIHEVRASHRNAQSRP